jgi:hypothetical protein
VPPRVCAQSRQQPLAVAHELAFLCSVRFGPVSQRVSGC